MTSDQLIMLIEHVAVYEYDHRQDDNLLAGVSLPERKFALADEVADIWIACKNFRGGVDITDNMNRPHVWRETAADYNIDLA